MFLSSIIVTVFMNIFRSRSEVFFKLGALKNFAIFRIKKDSNTSFPVNIAKFLRTACLQNSGRCFCIFLKVIKHPFRKGENVMTS